MSYKVFYDKIKVLSQRRISYASTHQLGRDSVQPDFPLASCLGRFGGNCRSCPDVPPEKEPVIDRFPTAKGCAASLPRTLILSLLFFYQDVYKRQPLSGLPILEKSYNWFSNSELCRLI